MSLTETKTIDKVEFVAPGHIQVREVTIIQRGDEEIARTYHRWCFAPNEDISGMPASVQAIAQAAWTPEVVSAYQAYVAEQQARIEVQK